MWTFAKCTRTVHIWLVALWSNALAIWDIMSPRPASRRLPGKSHRINNLFLQMLTLYLTKKKKNNNKSRGITIQNITRPTHEPRTDRGERCSHATPLGPARIALVDLTDPETLDEWVIFVVSCSQQTDSHLAPSRVAYSQRPPPQHQPLPTQKFKDSIFFKGKKKHRREHKPKE